MTATIKTYQLTRNKTATISCSKEGMYTLLVYNNGNSELIQANDIIIEKNYYAMIDAKNALYRFIKKECLQIIKEGK